MLILSVIQLHYCPKLSMYTSYIQVLCVAQGTTVVYVAKSMCLYLVIVEEKVIFIKGK